MSDFAAYHQDRLSTRLQAVTLTATVGWVGYLVIGYFGGFALLPALFLLAALLVVGILARRDWLAPALVLVLSSASVAAMIGFGDQAIAARHEWMVLVVLALAGLAPLPLGWREAQVALWFAGAALLAALHPAPFELSREITLLTGIGVAWVMQWVQERSWRRSWEDANLQIRLRQRLQRNKDALEEAVRDTREQLESQHAQLARQERLAALGRLSAGIAHEINNPLTVAMTNLDLARTEADAELLEDSIAALQRIRNIVADLSRVMRPDDNSTTADLNLGDAVKYAVDTARVSVSKSVRIRSQVPDHLAVRGNKGRLEQVLVNLIVNAGHAIQGAAGRGRIVVSCEAGDIVQLHVDDDGPGIPEEWGDQIFEPFFTTKRERGGTGLGLSLSRAYLRAMGGDLCASRSPLGGARLTLQLPVGELVDPTYERTNTATNSLPPFAASPVPPESLPVLLVVDDEAALRRALHRSLRGDWQVIAAADRDEAVQSLQEHPVEAVLCDLLLPDTDGVEVLRALSEHRPEILNHALLMSGEPALGHLLAVARSNTDRLVQKPFDMQDLKRRLRRAHRGHSKPLELDPPAEMGKATPFAAPVREAAPPGGQRR